MAVVLCAAPILCAQSFDVSSLTLPANLDGVWLLHAGDDAAYAQPGFDDAQGTKFDTSKSLHAIFPDGPPAVVYRLHARVSAAQQHLALQLQSPSSAFEVYVNGSPILR